MWDSRKKAWRTLPVRDPFGRKWPRTAGLQKLELSIWIRVFALSRFAYKYKSTHKLWKWYNSDLRKSRYSRWKFPSGAKIQFVTWLYFCVVRWTVHFRKTFFQFVWSLLKKSSFPEYMMVEEQRWESDRNKTLALSRTKGSLPADTFAPWNPDEKISRQKSENRNFIPAEKNTPMAGICSGPLTSRKQTNNHNTE